MIFKRDPPAPLMGREEEREQSSPSTLRVMDSLCCKRSRMNTEGETDGDGTEAPISMPLHDCLSEFSLASSAEHRSDLSRQVERLIKRHPAELEAFDGRGYLPVHVACREGAPMEVIHSLVSAYPKSLKTPSDNKQKMLPLHVACRYYSGKNSQKSRVLMFLARAYGKSLQTGTASGELPLHLLCRNYFCTVVDLSTLLDLYPPALTTKSTKRGQLPLHIACKSQYMNRLERKKRRKHHPKDAEEDRSSDAAEVIDFLLRASPETAEIRNSKGELPLHIAVRGHQSIETIELLLSAYPRAVQCLDKAGRTSLHVAVSRPNPNPAAIQTLLEANPDAMELRDQKGRLPIEYASDKEDMLELLSHQSHALSKQLTV